MAPRIPTKIACSSTVMLEHELSEVRAGLELTETEDTWNKICNALLRLNALAVGSSANYPTQLIAACKGLVRPIINSLNTERSRLSGAATDVLATFATHLRRSFEGLIPLFVPTLLSLASRSNKIFIARAKNCLMTIVENCQSPVILPLLRHAVSDKSVTLRLTATDLVMACLNGFNPPDLEAPNRVDDIETVIRATARDASADVRKSSRKVFEAYKILFPSRVDSFVAPLTPVMRKYLDIKAAPAAQRKPLLLSSSTSAPSLPSSIQAADPLTRSHPSTQSHVKSSSSTAFTRVGKPDKKVKPPKNETNKETVSMPPPAPPRAPTSGPVRPPPSMRQAVAAASAAPSRPLLVRHALAKSDTASTLDLTRSQPVSHGGAQRPTKTPTPSTTSSLPSPDAEQPAPNPLDQTVKERLKGAAKRVPKPEPVPLPSAPFPEQKQAESLKNSVKGREKAPFASSTSSTASTRETAIEPDNIHARSRPPSRLASSTRSKAGEEGEGERDSTRPSSRMGGEFRPRSRTDVERHKVDKAEPARPESRTGQFRPRPASKTEGKVHKRTDSKDKDIVSQTAARTERGVPVFSRPDSRAERLTQTRMEARDETKEVRPTKKATEQRPVEQRHPHVEPAQHHPEIQTDTHLKPQPDAPTKRVKSKKKAEECSGETRPSSEDPSQERKESRKAKGTKEVKEKRSAQDKPEKKKKRKVETIEVRHEEKQTGSGKLESSTSTQNEIVSTGNVEAAMEQDVPDPASKERALHEAVQDSHPEGELPNMNDHPAPADLHVDQIQLESSENTEANLRVDIAHATQGASSASESIPPSEHADVAEELIAEMKAPQRPTMPTARRHGRHGVRPLVIHKASHVGQAESERQEPDDDSDSEFDCEQENAYIAAADVPLPGTPPSSNCWIPPPREFETPAPLRQATAALKYKVANTPISKLLVSIEKGFEFDCSMIGEEDETEEEEVQEGEDGAVLEETQSQPDHSCVLEDKDAGTAEKGQEQEVEVDFGGPRCFVDMRRRKHKMGFKGGKQEERVPFTPRAENH